MTFVVGGPSFDEITKMLLWNQIDDSKILYFWVGVDGLVHQVKRPEGLANGIEKPWKG
jgi:hypothetical protein